MAEIARRWRGYGSEDGVERYCREHFQGRLLPQLRALLGFRGARLLVRDDGVESEVLVETRWESLEAVRSFAGEDYERAVVEPVVDELLDRYDAHVDHFEIALDADG